MTAFNASKNAVRTGAYKEATGYSNAGSVEECLRKNGVRVLYGKNGKVFTTIDAINAALGISSQEPNADPEINFVD